MFRPPPSRPKPPTPERKRPAAEPINLISDDEDDLEPPRGDIRPTDFKAHISSFVYKPRVELEQTTKRMRQIYDVFGDRFPSEKVREALRECDNDLEEAIAWLERVPKQTGRKLVSKASLGEPKQPSVTPSPPKQAKRRLVQGLRKRRETSPVLELPEEPEGEEEEEQEEPEVIDLVEDKADDYQAELSPSPTEDEDGRVLDSINNSTLQELAAMTGMKEGLLEPIIQSRPFSDLEEARKLSVSKKPGSRKSARISVGETAVDAVEVFLNAVDAIDEVVVTCEAKAQAVKSVMDTWDIDWFGYPKRSGRESPNVDAPPTPSSLGGGTRYVSPLVPRQPALMDVRSKMKPFQLFGLNWMTLLNNFDIGCILADEMGLGKTCQVISFICHLVESDAPRERRPWPNLIVVPPSTYNNWLGEFEKFAPGLSVVGYRGSQMERAEIAYQIEQEHEAYHVVLATYSQINSETDIEAMQSFHLNAAIFDEGHKMKNPETKLYRDLRRIPAAWKMLLTGKLF
jgi:SWI/SNF-related matrix-associated actin-dependent regulator 1 of chromatin subfamily A